MGRGGKKNISTATTTAVVSGSHVLEKIIVNDPGNGATIQILDSDNGTANADSIGTIAPEAPVTLNYGCTMKNGITIVTATGTTPANITVVYG